ncbi:hypothetical protein WJX73_007176 [Symbiochloris irregularis]|uniref:Uncharacterized protein n=1 Tax=Symbiochloris irregularis TaxID=706552 RepID=A0AAW1P0D4_9CHLO
MSSLWPKPRKRRWWISSAAIGVGAAAASYYLYEWYQQRTALPWSRSADARPDTPIRAPAHAHSPLYPHQSSTAPSGAPDSSTGLSGEADTNLQNHFDSIQIISERTTLPQMLTELVKGLSRTADVSTLIMRLKGLSSASPLADEVKLETWEQLKAFSFARLVCVVWLVPLLDLLLRVQLNILGRHLFLESHLLDRATALAWQQTAHAPRRVTKRAQELFLEVAHYLPERGTAVVVDRMLQAVEDALGDTRLDQTFGEEQLLSCLSAIHAEFEGWAVEQGWPQIVLPTSGEAALYFRGSLAPPDNQALAHHPSAEADEDIARRMVGELHTILASAKFAAAVQAAVREVARTLGQSLVADLGVSPLPLAKAVPRVVAAADGFLASTSLLRAQALGSVAQLPQVQKLCATVYSCGPPL